MKNSNFIPLVLLSSLFLFGCPDKDPEPDSTIVFVNNSNKTLLEYSVTNYFPDTTILVNNNPFDKTAKYHTISAQSRVPKASLWKSYLDAPNSTGVLTIFLFDKAVVDTVPWKTIREDYLVAKRYEYTLKQLDSLNWTITYP
jgi:hypothetical protein